MTLLDIEIREPSAISEVNEPSLAVVDAGGVISRILIRNAEIGISICKAVTESHLAITDERKGLFILRPALRTNDNEPLIMVD